ncbi:hypothetical protein [Streptomyces luteireticuli]|uniref:Uncharacterized protein n=1 Tax=Streptomyces luteireticuli TaxID=173858 RepID=A0ABN0Y5K8_9ACTN
MRALELPCPEAPAPKPLAEVIPLFPAGLPAELPAAPRPSHRRHLLPGCALTAAGLALLPWLLFLATVWREAAVWIGLDALEALALITTGVLTLRRDTRRVPAAAATAALLVLDAWFDAMTAAPGADLVRALITAGALELPLAAVCTVLAVRTPR